MKKGLLTGCWQGVTRGMESGERASTILRYFYPEWVSNLVLYSLLNTIDGFFIADLKSTTLFATLGVALSVLHFMTKLAEAAAGSITILSGQYNGTGEREKSGAAFVDAFWTIVVVGLVIASVLYFGAYYVFYALGISEKMIHLGIPFLRVRAIGLLVMFAYFGCVAFLRSFKNTRTPMQIFVVGAVFFVFFDYALIFGAFGFAPLGLLGSAYASLIQYSVMLVLALGYVLWSKECRVYGVRLFKSMGSIEYVKKIGYLSWPMMIDKATMAVAYMWLCAMIVPMGKTALASYNAILNLERFAFLPAMAFAQVITFLVSNDYGRQQWESIYANIKKIILLAALMIFCCLFSMGLCSERLVGIFDHKHAFVDFAAPIFPLLSFFVFFDMLQLILAGALRGTGDVRVVMWTRVIVLVGFFFPVSYVICWAPISSLMLKFFLEYALFYVSMGLTSVVYVWRLQSGAWKGVFKPK